MKLKLVFILFLFTANSFAQKSLEKLLNMYNTNSIPYISVEELRMHQLNDDVVILDSREKEEFNVSHISTAEYIGFKEFSAEKVSLQIPNKNKLIVIYCSVGIRSEKIGEKLQNEGYTNIKNLYGGIFEWKNKGYPVIDNKGQKTENIHIFSKKWGDWLKAGTPVY